ncbi:MAG: response regulator, partial [Erysipelotrichia bacterium]|nr:response regulator [Erysipelotrichia bacterium]
MMRRTLLIVDDIQINREILKKILGNEYQILEAENEQTAVDIMKRSYLTISAVLLDLSMPVMNGFDVLSCMRRNPDLKPIPVVVMTGQTGEDAEVKALKLGANDFISKPYNATVVRP